MQPNGAPIAALKNIGKAFAGVRVLHGVDLAFHAGSVHALMGENGAGKSTAMRMLAGLLSPDEGIISIAGEYVRIRDPHHAGQLGIAMIHQEPMVFPALTVAENIFAGREPARGAVRWLDREQMNREAGLLLQRVGAPVRPEETMGSLSVAAMQAVEIARAISTGARLIIMDEPTSALSTREAEALFAVIESLRREGTAIVYISHKLDEIFRLADTITVLRDGRCVASRPAADWNEPSLIAAMVGREVVAPTTSETQRREHDALPVLSIRDLARHDQFEGIGFDVSAGEIVGLAGLMGAGRTEVAHAIYGLEPADSGSIVVDGEARRIRHPSDAISAGIALVGEDRRDTGFVPELSVRHNVTLAALASLCSVGLIDARAECATADTAIADYAIKATSRDQSVRTLSGGNQQKVVIARALLTKPAVLILDEPTRGIDIGAKQEVYAIIRKLAAQGVAILLVSSELPELLALSDRVLTMCGGRIVAELERGEATQEAILRHAMPKE